MPSLATAMSVGWSLRSAIGFELEIPTRDGSWFTDDRPRPEAPAPEWHVREPSSLDSGQLIVSIGVLRDPSADLAKTAVVSPDSVLALHLAEPIVSGSVAQ